MSLVLNLPWTFVGILIGIISIPGKVHIERSAIVIQTRFLWWVQPLGIYKDIRGLTLGNIVLLGPSVLPNTFEHELVHVRQFKKYPFIFPFLYLWELIRHGYRKNRFELEAYAAAKN